MIILRACLTTHGDELHFVLNTSTAQVQPADRQSPHLVPFATGPDVRPLSDEKCRRYWHRRADVGAHDQPAVIGARYSTDVDVGGETRQWK